MRRPFLFVVAPVLAALVLAGCSNGNVADGNAAFTVRGHDTSQQSVDEELEVLAESEALKEVVEPPGSQQVLSRTNGSISSDLAAGWLSQLIALDVVSRNRARQGIDVTRADLARGRELAMQNVGGQQVYVTLPRWFRDQVAGRWAELAAVQREFIASSPDEVTDALAAACSSGRYVSHILVATQAEAEQIAAELATGGDFAAIARERSTDTGSGSQGGELGCVDGQQFVEPFATAAAALPVGQLSDPVQTEFGFHLIRVTNDPPAAELDRVTLDRILSGIQGVRVEVDPRYGTWDRGNGQVVAPSA